MMGCARYFSESPIRLYTYIDFEEKAIKLLSYTNFYHVPR